MDNGPRFASAITVLALLAPASQAGELVDLTPNDPQVRFDLPAVVAAREVDGADEVAHLGAGERLLMVELPVSVLVRRGNVGRVDEVVVEVDGSPAGLRVHDYAPATRLETEYAAPIQVTSTTENHRHREVSLGGKIGLGGAVSQLTPGGGVSRTQQAGQQEKASRLPPKLATVVSGPIHQRQGVLFKFRPSSQTTLEGEHPLRLTLVAPADWAGGSLQVRCQATGEKKVLFVKQPATWGRAVGQVLLLEASPQEQEGPLRQTAAKPVTDPTTPSATGPVWKPRASVE